MTKTITPHESVRKTLIVKPDADVTASELDLLKTDAQFKQAWDRKRRVTDQSASAYESVIADLAMRAECDDQKICNLLIAHRRTHGEGFKPERDYYERVITEARARMAVAEKLKSYGARKTHSREEALADLLTLLSVRVTSIQRFMTDPRSYVMRLDNGSYVEFRTSREMFDQNSLRQALIDYTSVKIPRFKNVEWDDVENCMIECVEDVESSSESTHLGATIEWLRTYIRKHLRPDMPRDGQISAAIEGKPAVLDGGICFSMDGLKRSIMLESSEQPPAKTLLAVRLRQIGCEYQPQVSLRPSGGSNTSRSLWFVPMDFKTEDESQPDDNSTSF